MADLVDLAQTQNERVMEFTLKSRKGKSPEATGFCLNCDEPVPESIRWCGVECRDDWERFDKILRERGM